jgi:hypothetical protein
MLLEGDSLPRRRSNFPSALVVPGLQYFHLRVIDQRLYGYNYSAVCLAMLHKRSDRNRSEHHRIDFFPDRILRFGHKQDVTL